MNGLKNRDVMNDLQGLQLHQTFRFLSYFVSKCHRFTSFFDIDS